MNVIKTILFVVAILIIGAGLVYARLWYANL